MATSCHHLIARLPAEVTGNERKEICNWESGFLALANIHTPLIYPHSLMPLHVDSHTHSLFAKRWKTPSETLHHPTINQWRHAEQEFSPPGIMLQIQEIPWLKRKVHHAVPEFKCHYHRWGFESWRNLLKWFKTAFLKGAVRYSGNIIRQGCGHKKTC